jgi:hypothetical protein
MVGSGISNIELLGYINRQQVSRMRKMIKIRNEMTEQNKFDDVYDKGYA